MPAEGERYDMDQALNEATDIKSKIESGVAENYQKANEIVDVENQKKEEINQEVRKLVADTIQAVPWAIAETRLKQMSPSFYTNSLEFHQQNLEKAKTKGDDAKISEARKSVERAANAQHSNEKVIEFLEGILSGNLPDDWTEKPDWHSYNYDGVYRHNVSRIAGYIEQSKTGRYDRERKEMIPVTDAELSDKLRKMLVGNMPPDVSEEDFERLFRETLERYKQLEAEKNQ